MYHFIREDTGEVVTVDFSTMMGSDVAGYITLPDGVRARRIMSPVANRLARNIATGNANHTPPVSDALGFTAHQLSDFEEDRVKNGFTGVEFTQDPTCPVFYQVRFSSHKERERYIRHRGMVDQNKTVAAALSKKDLDDACEWAKSRY